MKHFDIIIIGAGPGGLACANELANSSLSVLLIDKNKIIGPKNCGGGLTSLMPQISLPQDKIKIFAKDTIIYDSNKLELQRKHPLKTISRHELGKWQLKELQNADNVKIMPATVLNKINNNFIQTSAGDFSFSKLVGADGSSSRVRSFLELSSLYMSGIYYEINKKVDNLFFEYFSDDKLGLGYYWHFPHQNNINIGIYYNPLYATVAIAKSKLNKYINDLGYSVSNNVVKGANINCKYNGCLFDNFYLIGDAAGLPSRLTGEGISFAICSGLEIARKIKNPDYKMSELNEILKFKKRQDFLYKSYYFVPKFLRSVLVTFFIKQLSKNKVLKYLYKD